MFVTPPQSSFASLSSSDRFLEGSVRTENAQVTSPFKLKRLYPFSKFCKNIKNFVPLSPLLSKVQSFTILVYRQKKDYLPDLTNQKGWMEKDAFTTHYSPWKKRSCCAR
jgi:hypothetical protein